MCVNIFIATVIALSRIVCSSRCATRFHDRRAARSARSRGGLAGGTRVVRSFNKLTRARGRPANRWITCVARMNLPQHSINGRRTASPKISERVNRAKNGNIETRNGTLNFPFAFFSFLVSMSRVIRFDGAN